MDINGVKELKILLNENPYATLEIESTDTTKTVKKVSFDSLLKLLTNTIKTQKKDRKKEEKKLLKSGLLSCNFDTNIISYNVSEDGLTKKFVILKRNNCCNLIYLEKTVKNVPLPDLIFSIEVNENVFGRIRVFAIKDKIISENTELYKFPLGNVFSEGGICWGGNPLSTIADANKPETFHKLIGAFLTSPFLDHNYHDRNNTNKSQLEYMKYIKENGFEETLIREPNATILKNIM